METLTVRSLLDEALGYARRFCPAQDPAGGVVLTLLHGPRASTDFGSILFMWCHLNPLVGFHPKTNCGG